MIASRSVGRSAISFSSCFFASSVRLHGFEIDGDLDVGVAAQRQVLGDPLINLDRQRVVLLALVDVREREQREPMLRHQIERELQIDETDVVAAPASERGAEAVEHLGGAGLGGIDERRQFVAAAYAVAVQAHAQAHPA